MRRAAQRRQYEARLDALRSGRGGVGIISDTGLPTHPAVAAGVALPFQYLRAERDPLPLLAAIQSRHCRSRIQRGCPAMLHTHYWRMLVLVWAYSLVSNSSYHYIGPASVIFRDLNNLTFMGQSWPCGQRQELLRCP